MATPWTFPRQLSQHAEPDTETVHIPWHGDFTQPLILNSTIIETAGNLYHIARSPKHDIRNKTWFLKATKFNFSSLPNEIQGIEMKLTSNRRGRIVDECVQLCFNDDLLGKNKADLDLSPEKIYGSPTDKWETKLTATEIADQNFGIMLRFQSHPKWPHRDPIIIYGIELRIH